MCVIVGVSLLLVEKKKMRDLCPYLDGFVVVLMNDILIVPNSSEHFIVYNDTSKMSLSDVLMLKGLAPRWLKTHEGELSYHKLELAIDYNFDLSNHLGKANVVVNALSRKPCGIKVEQWKHNGYRDLRDLSLVCKVTLNSMKLNMLKIGRVITHEKRTSVKIRTDEVMRFYDKIHVLDVIELRKLILQGLNTCLIRMY
ncbi:hypothetical protein CR513_25327, partial [Mucuna pruriens]